MNRDNTPAQDTTILPPATSAGAAAIGGDRQTPRRRWGLMPPFVPHADRTDRADPAPLPDAPEPPTAAAPAVNAEPWADAPETAEPDAGVQLWTELPRSPDPWAETPIAAGSWGATEPNQGNEPPAGAEPAADMQPPTGSGTPADTDPWAAAGPEPQAASEPWAARPGAEPYAAQEPWAAAEPVEVAPHGATDPWDDTAAPDDSNDATHAGVQPEAGAFDDPESPWSTSSDDARNEWEPWLASPPPEPRADATRASPHVIATSAEEPAPDVRAAAGEPLSHADAQARAAPAEEAEPWAAQVEADPWTPTETPPAPAGAADDLSPADFPWLPGDAPDVTGAGPQDPADHADHADHAAGASIHTPFSSPPDSFFADAFFSPGAMQSTDTADEQHADRIMAGLVAERLDDLSRQIREHGFSALVGSLDPDQLSRVLAAVVAGYMAGHE
jgi:hypothetical protein